LHVGSFSALHPIFLFKIPLCTSAPESRRFAGIED